MKIKKHYGVITISFEVQGKYAPLTDGNILSDIASCLTSIKLINKNKPFDDLIKLQQKNPKHILVDFDPDPLDELRFFVNTIQNFLTETNQSQFIFSCLTVAADTGELVFYPTDWLDQKTSNNITFSPFIRCDWKNNPTLTEKILNL